MRTNKNVTTVSARGSIVIPLEIRKRLGLKRGDRVHFIDYGGVVTLWPVSDNPLKDAAGMLKGGKSLTLALLRSRRLEAG